MIALQVVGWWLALGLLTMVAARKGGWVGAALTQIVVAILVAADGVMAVQAEMRRPDWPGQPDQDMVFALSMLFWSVVVNTTLLPFAVIGVRRRGRP